MGTVHRRGVVLALVVAVAAIGCRAAGPIEVGLLAGLTGPASEPGVISRDAALLAAGEINALGGIGGRRLELVVADTGGTIDGADAQVRALIDRGVPVIVGPMLSAMAHVVIAHAHSPVLFVSPLISTPVLSGRDDNFIRISAGADLQAETLAAAMLGAGVRRVCIVVDGTNALYSVELASILRRRLEAGGVLVSEQLDVATTTLASAADAIVADEPDAVAFATNGYTAGIIAQELAERGPLPRVFGVSWTATSDVIVHGGHAVEGALLTSDESPNVVTPEQRRFMNAFVERYGRVPEPLAENAYEAVGIISDALRRVDRISADALRDEIIRIGRFGGLRGPIVIDEYGDSQRRVALVTVREGRFRTVSE